jgi:Tol biopolymer transport system component/DNA-binding winged helix-turn-helix (wHTH) protein
MQRADQPESVVRFGTFEMDFRAEELRKNGRSLKLRGQPFQVLSMLLDRPGALVTREELRQRLWPQGTFVDFDHSLNAAVNRIREVLGDSAENPQFVETLARRGYRFIAAVENAGRDIKTERAASDDQSLAEPKRPVGVEEPLPEKEAPPERKSTAGRLVRLTALAVLVVGGVAWFYFSRLESRSSMLPPMRVIRLTSFPGKETEPALSPDGKMVAFVWDGEKGDNRDIYVMLVDAGKPLRLTSDPGDDFSPSWSPDGRYIAFGRISHEGGGFYMVPALGGPERKLAASLNPGALDWSPDGKLIAISERNSDQHWALFLVSVETGEKTRLTFPPGGPGDYSPAFSPDGQSVAFTRSISITRADVWRVPTKGGNPIRVTFDNKSAQAAWTADGREIILSHPWSPGKGLYRTMAEGGKAAVLIEGGQFGGSPRASRQGKRLVYSERTYDTDIWQIELSELENRVSSMTRLVSSSQQEDMAEFSPNGKKIVFDSNRSGSFEVWVSDSDGKNLLRLTIFGGPFVTGSPHWSPDGKFIAFDSRPRGLSDIFVISAEGGAPRCLTEEGSKEVAPSWSRDGRWIYFGSDRSGKGDWQLWKVAPEGGEIVRVTKNGGFEAQESRDGKFIYYSKTSPVLSNLYVGYDNLWRVPASSGEETLFLREIESRYWALGERGIYFIADEDKQPYLKFVDFATRRTISLAPLNKKLATDAARGLSLSGDGRSLLCTLVEQDSSDIMLVENFR